MENWARADMIGVISLVVAIIAAVANILVMDSVPVKRGLMLILTLALLGLMAFVYKTESAQPVEEPSPPDPGIQEARDSFKREEAMQEEAVKAAIERIRNEQVRRERIDQLARDLVREAEKKSAEEAALREAKTAIVGTWSQSAFYRDIRFTEDGKFETTEVFPILRLVGSYKFKDPSHFELYWGPQANPSIVHGPFRIEIRFHDTNELLLESDLPLCDGHFKRKI